MTQHIIEVGHTYLLSLLS